MDEFSDLISAVQSDLNVSTNSSLYPSATIKLALNRAYNKSGALFKWPALQDSQKTSTVASQEYYEAPTTWRPNSIWRLEVDSVMYGQEPDGSPMSFDDFLIWKTDYSTSTDKKWAVQWLRYFIHPIPTTNGSNNITIWGFKNVTELVNDSDTTIFSSNLPECNDAIVMEAAAILKTKGEAERSSQFVSTEAKQILSITFSKIKSESAKFEKNQPFFYTGDFYGKGYQGWDYDPTEF